MSEENTLKTANNKWSSEIHSATTDAINISEHIIYCLEKATKDCTSFEDRLGGQLLISEIQRLQQKIRLSQIILQDHIKGGV